jgi:hypothetical protein
MRVILIPTLSAAPKLTLWLPLRHAPSRLPPVTATDGALKSWIVIAAP